MEKSEQKLLLKLAAMSFALVLLFSSCSIVDTETGAQQISGIGSGSSSISSSQKGLQIEFSDGRPPSDMFKSQGYTFAFVITNNLLYDIDDLVVSSRGFEENFVSGIPSEASVGKIPRASSQAGPSKFGGLVFDGVVVDNFEGSEYSFNPIFDYCYSAKTSFVEQFCIPNSRNECDIKEQTSKILDGVVGASVKTLQSTKESIIVQLEIRNRGDGEVVNTCFNTRDFKRSIDNFEAKLGTDSGDCTPVSSDDFALINDILVINCLFDRTQEGAYNSQLNLNYNYKYQQTTQKNIKVKNLEKAFS